MSIENIPTDDKEKKNEAEWEEMKKFSEEFGKKFDKMAKILLAASVGFIGGYLDRGLLDKSDAQLIGERLINELKIDLEEISKEQNVNQEGSIRIADLGAKYSWAMNSLTTPEQMEYKKEHGNFEFNAEQTKIWVAAEKQMDEIKKNFKISK